MLLPSIGPLPACLFSFLICCSILALGVFFLLFRVHYCCLVVREKASYLCCVGHFFAKRTSLPMHPCMGKHCARGTGLLTQHRPICWEYVPNLQLLRCCHQHQQWSSPHLPRPNFSHAASGEHRRLGEFEETTATENTEAAPRGRTSHEVSRPSGFQIGESVLLLLAHGITERRCSTSGFSRATARLPRHPNDDSWHVCM